MLGIFGRLALDRKKKDIFELLKGYPYCGSCSGVIHQLSDMIPNVEIIIVNGAK